MFGVERDTRFSKEFLEFENMAKLMSNEADTVEAEQRALRDSLMLTIFDVAPTVDVRIVETKLRSVKTPAKKLFRSIDHEEAIDKYLSSLEHIIGSMSLKAEFRGVYEEEEVAVSTYGIPSLSDLTEVKLCTDSFRITVNQNGMLVDDNERYLTPESLEEAADEIQKYSETTWTDQKLTYFPRYGFMHGSGVLKTYLQNLENSVNGVYLPLHKNGSTEM